MLVRPAIEEQIRTFVIQTFPAARKRPLDDDTPLLESGIIDSLGTLDVVTFLEKSFRITVADDELTPENFANIRALSTFVEKKTEQVRALAK
jgi:acyl carrier protein